MRCGGDKMEYTSKQFEQILGFKANTLHYYVDAGGITPDIDQGAGRGTSRRFSFANLVEGAIIRRLLDYGIPRKTIIAGLRSIADANERHLLKYDHLFDAHFKGLFLAFTLDRAEKKGGRFRVQHEFISGKDTKGLNHLTECVLINLAHVFALTIVLLKEAELLPIAQG